jgi:colanic acid/amylovoran biosynthesis glycosyltransferase
VPHHDTAGTVGYVLKMYPRLSETFILTEVLQLEAQGQPVEIFSLRPPTDGRFHAELAQVQAPVSYLPSGSSKARTVWEVLAAAAKEFPHIYSLMPELVAAPVDDALQAIALAHEVRARGIARLHAHFASVATTVARLASLITGVPYTFTAHAKDIFHRDVDPEDLRRKLRDAEAVVTVSDFNLEHLRGTYGPDAASVRRVYNGLDLDRHPYVAPVGRPPVIAAVGRLVEKKGFVDLVDACRLLAERGVDFRCVLVGGGPEEATLRARITRHGLDDRVELLGRRPQGAVQDIVRSAAVFAAPCVVGADGNRDGLPTVLLESMALGTPCISTPVTGIPEVVRHRETGLLVGERDVPGLADALEELLADEQLRQRLAAAARALIERDFDSQRQAEQLRQLFAADPALLTAVG